MYLQHFQLSEPPFSLTPNLSMYCNTSQHEEAIQLLLYGLSQGEGLMKMVGEIGLGKTLLCRKLLDTLPDEYCTSYIFNPCLSGDELLRAICADLGVELPKRSSRLAITNTLSKELLKKHEENKRVVLIVDEAHLLSDEALEMLRLLTNLETNSNKLFQIILVGHPELDVRLEKPHLRQIQQRIAYSYYLKGLDPSNTKQYLAQRLISAGHCHGQILSNAALKMLNYFAGGVPRIINILCDKALLIAYSRGKNSVDYSDIRKAVKDSRNLIRTTIYHRLARRKATKQCLIAGISLIGAGILACSIMLLFQR